MIVRPEPWYRKAVIVKGLAAAGWDVREGNPEKPQPQDVLAIWNRYHTGHQIATQFEQQGGTTVVLENGFLGRGGSAPKFDLRQHGPQPQHYLAMAIGRHNGAGWWPDGDGSRWHALGVDLEPWRRDGGHILVCPSRPFGVPGEHMPHDWAEVAADRLRSLTRREVRIRSHPGNDAPRKPLADDLAGAWCTVIWASSAGIHSLVAGVPVLCDAPHWICKGAAGSLKQVESPPMPDRLPVMQRMAWAQWTCQELESGEPFRRLLCTAG